MGWSAAQAEVENEVLYVKHSATDTKIPNYRMTMQISTEILDTENWGKKLKNTEIPNNELIFLYFPGSVSYIWRNETLFCQLFLPPRFAGAARHLDHPLFLDVLQGPVDEAPAGEGGDWPGEGERKNKSWVGSYRPMSPGLPG